MSNLKLDVVTPEEVMISQDVDQVVVPGVDGEFGVLANHAPVISSLRPGVVRVYDGSNRIVKRVLITGGFAEITAKRCTILADEAHDFAVVTKEELEKRHAAIKKIHDDAKDEIEKKLVEKQVNVAQEIIDSFVRECDTFGR